MSGRVNAFADLTEAPVFEVKPKVERPVAKDAVEQIAEDHNFPSRQARKKPSAPARKPRIYRTGRNRHFGVKATNETVERFYKMADERKLTLGALLELALDALARTGAAEPE
ncbi:MAG TPA: hypothetical protein VGG72_20225 [Bryobacteraceae bacterium]|jgi:hypothetical protein